jgi:excisionase family DNA binding protein
MAEASNPPTGAVETDEELLRVATVSRRWDIPPSTVTYWIRTKRLPAYIAGRTYRVRAADVQALLRAVE